MASQNDENQDEFIRNLLCLPGTSAPCMDSHSVADEINRLESIVSENSPQTYSCSKCTKVFSTKKALTRHSREVKCKLRKTGGHVCSLCEGKTFSNAFSLRRHVRSVHGEQRPGTSAPSTHSHSVADEISRLENIVSENTPHTYSCSKLRKTGGHVCSLCEGKTFSNAFSLRRHVRSVHGSQRHICSGCHKMAVVDILVVTVLR